MAVRKVTSHFSSPGPAIIGGRVSPPEDRSLLRHPDNLSVLFEAGLGSQHEAAGLPYPANTR